jgi:solute carrier family 25 carnitine/acylcarnitine transporter 20/29
MAHNEKRSSPLREGGIAIFTGAMYGVVHTLSGHPLDNVKAKLQLDRKYHGKSTFAAIRTMWEQGRWRIFWRGCVPPLWGSAVYRSIMMSAYEGSFTYLEQHSAPHSFWRQEYCCKVLRPLVVASAVVCSLCRCVAEAPIEQAKVMGQTGRPWSLSLSLYRGLFEQTLRTTAMLTFIFVPYDYARRETTLFQTLSGQALTCGVVCAGVCVGGGGQGVCVCVCVCVCVRQSETERDRGEREICVFIFVCVCLCV